MSSGVSVLGRERAGAGEVPPRRIAGLSPSGPARAVTAAERACGLVAGVRPFRALITPPRRHRHRYHGIMAPTVLRSERTRKLVVERRIVLKDSTPILASLRGEG